MSENDFHFLEIRHWATGRELPTLSSLRTTDRAIPLTCSQQANMIIQTYGDTPLVGHATSGICINNILL
jgi:hypothetical protein